MHACEEHNPYERLTSSDLWRIIEGNFRLYPFRAAAAVSSTGFTEEDMHRLATHPNEGFRCLAAMSPKLAPDDACSLLSDEVEDVRLAVSENPILPATAVLKAWRRGDLTLSLIHI